MEPRNRFQGMNSASLCSLAGRYNNPIPTRFLASIDCLKIPAQHRVSKTAGGWGGGHGFIWSMSFGRGYAVKTAMSDEDCSAQTRTVIGLLRKPPAVKQFPTVESHLGVRASYTAQRKRGYEANKCG
jgi:hypothetical protein